MFAGQINHAKAAASHLVLRYVARASVAIPFLIALGFALAAITVTLVQHYGQVAAYWMVAGGLAVIGIVAAIAVTVKEHGEEGAAAGEAEPAAQSTSDASGEAPAEAMAAPIALVGALLSAPGGPSTAFRVARLLGRNFPLVLLLVMIGGLFWPTGESTEEQFAGTGEGKPNGHHPDTYH